MSNKTKKMVSIFDPTVNAYREVPEDLAQKFISSAKEVEAKQKEIGEKSQADNEKEKNHE